MSATIFENGHPGPPPKGVYDGTVNGWPFRTIWQGKVFFESGVVNRLGGREAIHGEVVSGFSKVDSKPCYVITYSILPFLRDEIRSWDDKTFVGVMLIGRFVAARFMLVSSEKDRAHE